MIFSSKIEIHPHEVDYSKHLSPISLGAYILDTAGRAANAHGFGMDFLNKSGCSWVLSRLSVEIYQMPKEYESITINTWVRSVNSLFSKRLFTILDSEGRLIAEADSLWSVINMESRKAADLCSLSNISDFIVDVDVAMSSTVKVPKANEALSLSFIHNIKYSDIDMNIHVNSMKYLQWAMDTYSLDFYKEKSIKRYDINYLKEMRFGNTATLHREEKGENAIFSVSDNDQISCCRIKFSY